MSRKPRPRAAAQQLLRQVMQPALRLAMALLASLVGPRPVNAAAAQRPEVGAAADACGAYLQATLHALVAAQDNNWPRGARGGSWVGAGFGAWAGAGFGAWAAPRPAPLPHWLDPQQLLALRPALWQLRDGSWALGHAGCLPTHRLSQLEQAAADALHTLDRLLGPSPLPEGLLHEWAPAGPWAVDGMTEAAAAAAAAAAQHAAPQTAHQLLQPPPAQPVPPADGVRLGPAAGMHQAAHTPANGASAGAANSRQPSPLAVLQPPQSPALSSPALVRRHPSQPAAGAVHGPASYKEVRAAGVSGPAAQRAAARRPTARPTPPLPLAPQAVLMPRPVMTVGGPALAAAGPGPRLPPLPASAPPGAPLSHGLSTAAASVSSGRGPGAACSLDAGEASLGRGSGATQEELTGPPLPSVGNGVPERRCASHDNFWFSAFPHHFTSLLRPWAAPRHAQCGMTD